MEARFLNRLVSGKTCRIGAGRQADEAGRNVAEQHFSRCHLIGGDNEYKDRFATFFARCPHPVFAIIQGYGRRMPERLPNVAPMRLPLRAAADVVAFVKDAAQEALSGLLHELGKMSVMNSAFIRQAQPA
jgi:hypothetical protein